MNEELRERLQELLKKTNDVLQLPITCPKCHGEGTYRVPILDDNGEWGYEWKSCQCELCHGTGKISLQFYEDLQKGVRR